MVQRRDFLGSMAALTASAAFKIDARSYRRIIGANDRVNLAVVGLNSRASAHLDALKATPNTAIPWICDVDSTIADRFAASVTTALGTAPRKEKDIRRLLEQRDVDAITIATPDHWHAPMAIMALQAGKHVYVEKPCSHNPHEGELLVAAEKQYGNVVQMGNQQRSSAHTIEIIGRIHQGLIGTPYFAKAWYANTRKSIGVGRVTPVPATLDWDLFQGPAPRRAYTDNMHPYNWHWFWHYGTGESLNNGTHEVDVCRWALGAGMPTRVTASGGRYHFHDDWQFYDTLVTNFEYADRMITWEGMSCQGKQYYGRSRGATIHGTTGTVLVDRDGFEVYDLDDKKVESFTVSVQAKATSRDLVGMDAMTTDHFRNFIGAITNGETLRAPVAEGNVSVTMLQLSNIAWKTGRALDVDTATGRILRDASAMSMWQREYEKGWEPRV